MSLEELNDGLKAVLEETLEIALWSPTDSHKEAPKIASLVVSEVRAHARAQQPLPDDELPHSPIPAHPAVGDGRD